MKQIKDLLEFLDDKYMKWMWLLIRLIMCVCVFNFAIYALTTLWLTAYPIISLILGKGFSGFFLWYFAPVTFVVAWILYDICKMVYEEYIDTGLY